MLHVGWRSVVALFLILTTLKSRLIEPHLRTWWALCQREKRERWWNLTTALKASAHVTSTAVSFAKGNHITESYRNVKPSHIETQWLFWKIIKSTRESMRHNCLKSFSLYDPAIPLLGIYPEKTLIWKHTCTPVFIAALVTIAKTWKQPKCPSPDEWIKKMWCRYTVEYYSAIKRIE